MCEGRGRGGREECGDGGAELGARDVGDGSGVSEEGGEAQGRGLGVPVEDALEGLGVDGAAEGGVGDA